jgi:hypothetical protein
MIFIILQVGVRKAKKIEDKKMQNLEQFKHLVNAFKWLEGYRSKKHITFKKNRYRCDKNFSAQTFLCTFNDEGDFILATIDTPTTTWFANLPWKSVLISPGKTILSLICNSFTVELNLLKKQNTPKFSIELTTKPVVMDNLLEIPYIRTATYSYVDQVFTIVKQSDKINLNHL